jgi:hypothetical protein
VATILIAVSPVDEPTRYGYAYWKRYAQTSAENGHQIVILKNASLSTFQKALHEHAPRLVIMDSHGGSRGVEVNGHVILGVKGYDPELGLKIHDTNTYLMRNRIVLLMTCNTMKELGFRLIDAGAVAVAGFKEPFIFLSEEHVSNPLNDKTAYPFFISLMQPALQLAKGKTFREAVNITRKAFEYYRDLAEAKGDETSAKYLNWDAYNFVAAGNMEARL